MAFKKKITEQIWKLSPNKAAKKPNTALYRKKIITDKDYIVCYTIGKSVYEATEIAQHIVNLHNNK